MQCFAVKQGSSSALGLLQQRVPLVQSQRLQIPCKLETFIKMYHIIVVRFIVFIITHGKGMRKLSNVFFLLFTILSLYCQYSSLAAESEDHLVNVANVCTQPVKNLFLFFMFFERSLFC